MTPKTMQARKQSFEIQRDKKDQKMKPKNVS